MFSLRTFDRIDRIAAEDWNSLADPDTPFLRHAFLAALEHQGCLGEAYGWLPRHLGLYDADDRLVAAAPCYLKFNSYGEFVFDWAWADAYRRAGLDYYPKLIVASPYTPATGARILTDDSPQRTKYATALANGARQLAERLGVSSLHWLFTTEQEAEWLEGAGLMRRMGCQFHWTNRGYRNFDDFLAALSSAKRKKIKRERRRVQEAGIRFRRLRGSEVGEEEWDSFHALYCGTFDKRGGIPTLSRGFFEEIGHTMGDNLLLVLAYHRNNPVAAAFSLIGTKSLYGRHWGCSEDFHSLHFETCYYQGLDFCIENALQRFEPGAQGEHKISRGFLPTATWSTHWIADGRFHHAIGHFLEQESVDMKGYLEEMNAHNPYKTAEPS